MNSFTKKLFGFIASFGLLLNGASVQAAMLNDVKENAPIVLKQNSSFANPALNDSVQQANQPLYHGSHYSHSSHASHYSHQSHYSSRY